MFALIGISLLKGKMGYCDGVGNIYGVGLMKVKKDSIFFRI
jgi:hypothetical protein